MNDLIAWLRVQLAKQESDALAARRVATDGDLLGLIDFTLAEVDAKRRILDLYEASRARHPDASPDAWIAMKRVVRLLALPYADREGYRSEWAP